MQYRQWRRKTAGQHKVDAPLPRLNTATAVKWRTTFKQLNMSMDGLTTKDLVTPLLDLSIPGFSEGIRVSLGVEADAGSDGSMGERGGETEEQVQEGEGREEGGEEEGEESPLSRGLKSSSAYDRRSSVEIIEEEVAFIREDNSSRERESMMVVETSTGPGRNSRPSSSYSQQRPSSRSSSSRPAVGTKVCPDRRPSTSSMQRPRSQQSSRPSAPAMRSRSRSTTQPTRASTAKPMRSSPSVSMPPASPAVIIDVPVHKGRPVDFSRALMGAYMGAASNDSVRAMLNKTRAWDK